MRDKLLRGLLYCGVAAASALPACSQELAYTLTGVANATTFDLTVTLNSAEGSYGCGYEPSCDFYPDSAALTVNGIATSLTSSYYVQFADRGPAYAQESDFEVIWTTGTGPTSADYTLAFDFPNAITPSNVGTIQPLDNYSGSVTEGLNSRSCRNCSYSGIATAAATTPEPAETSLLLLGLPVAYVGIRRAKRALA